MFDYYEKSLNSLNQRKNPFKTFIDEICNGELKKVNIFTEGKNGLREQKDRAYTFNHASDIQGGKWRNRGTAFDLKSDLKLKIPLKNPIHEISQRANINVQNN
jgi:hypothetical protein